MSDTAKEERQWTAEIVWVQTAPGKCRYTKTGICANIAGFCLCRQANFVLPSSHDARTKKKRRLTGSPVNWRTGRALSG